MPEVSRWTVWGSFAVMVPVRLLNMDSIIAESGGKAKGGVLGLRGKLVSGTACVLVHFAVSWYLGVPTADE